MGQYHCVSCQEYLEKAQYYHQMMERNKCCDDKKFLYAYKKYCHYCKKAAECQRRYPQPMPYFGYQGFQGQQFQSYPGYPISSP